MGGQLTAEDRTLVRIASVSAILGSLIFLSVNVWHDSVSHSFATLVEGKPGVLEVFVGVPIGSVAFFVLTIVAYLGLYHVLKEDRRAYATLAFTIGVAGLLLAIVTRITRIGSVLALADSYAKAAAGSAEQAAATVGNSMTLNAFRWGISTAEALISISFIVFGLSMLRSAVFGKKLGWAGIVVGIVILLIRPLPAASGALSFLRPPASFTVMSILILFLFVTWASSMLREARKR